MLGERGIGFWLLPILLCVMLVAMLLLGQLWLPQGMQRNEERGAGSEELELDHEGMGGEKRGLDHGEIASGTTPHIGWVPTVRPSGKTVALTIDFGNGAKREFSALPWRSGMTVADLMEAARHFRPPISYAQKGTGAQAFLTILEGVAGKAEYGKFWFFEINGARGIRSFGVQDLNPGDYVLWKYGSVE